MTNSVAARKKALEAMLAKNKDVGTEAGQSSIFVNRISGKRLSNVVATRARRASSVQSPYLPNQPLQEEDQAKIQKLEEELKAQQKLEQEQQEQQRQKEQEELRRLAEVRLAESQRKKEEEEELLKQRRLQEEQEREQQRKKMEEEEERRRRLEEEAEQQRRLAAAEQQKKKKKDLENPKPRDEKTIKMLQDKLEQHKASLVSSAALVDEDINDPFVQEELARKTEEYKKVLEIKLAAKEERRQALEEKLSANKAVKVGQQLLESNNMFTPAMRQRAQAINQAIEESNQKMQEHKKAYDKVIGFMKARVEKHNEETKDAARAVEAQKAAIQAEKEHAKAVKAVKKLEDQRKREEYEKRRERRASLALASRQQ